MMKENEVGISIERQNINYFRFVDDTVIICNNKESLQRIIRKLEEGMKE